MRIKTREMILAALFAALTAAGAFIKIPVGPAPVTLQLFFSILSGLLLGPGAGALSQLIYVALGLAGLPVFASGGGPTYVFNPAFGYLPGLVLAALVSGAVFGRPQGPSFPRALLACAAGTLAVYLVGVPYLYVILRYVNRTGLTFAQATGAGFLIFLPGDALKCLAAAFLGVKILPAVRKNTRP